MQDTNTLNFLFYFIYFQKEKRNITAVPELISNSPEVRNTLPHSQSRRGRAERGIGGPGDPRGGHPQANAAGSRTEASRPRQDQKAASKSLS